MHVFLYFTDGSWIIKNNVQWKYPDFLNPRFLKNHDNLNQKISDFSNQFLFPLEDREIGIPLYVIFLEVIPYMLAAGEHCMNCVILKFLIIKTVLNII